MDVRELITKIGFKTDTSSLNKFEENVNSAKSSILALTAAITAAATAVFVFVESAAKAGDRLDKLRDTVGITTREYQLLEGAANLAGIENDEFSKSMQLFSRAIGMARQGMSQYIKQLAILGINIRGSDGQIKSNKELLLEVADAFQNKLVNSADRAAVSQLFFGRTGGKMINFLEKGRAGISEATKEFGKYAFILNDKAIKKSQEFRDSQFLLESAIKGVKNEIGIGMMPIVQKLINQTLEWIRENRKLIVSGLQEFFKAMIFLAKSLGNMMAIVVSVVKDAVDVWNHLNNAFGWTVKILTSLLALKLLAKLKMFKTLISGGLGLMKFIFSPIGLISAAIVGLLLVLDDLAVYLTGGKSLIGLVVKKFPLVGKMIKEGMKGMKFLINLTIIEPLKLVMAFIKFIEQHMAGISSTAMKLGKLALSAVPGVGLAGDVKGIVNVLSPKPASIPGIGNSTSSKHMNINTSVNVTVPPGTSEEQQGFLHKAAQKAFEPVMQRTLINALAAFPGVEQ